MMSIITVKVEHSKGEVSRAQIVAELLTALGHTDGVMSYSVVRDEDLLSKVSTKELTEELAKREGVQELDVRPYGRYEIRTPDETIISSGPARILINID